MSPATRGIVRRAAVAARVVGGIGFVAAVAIVLFSWLGQPWGTINDLALLIATAAIPLLMLAFWELGGLTPTPLALTAQALGWLSVSTWCVTHALYVAGVVGIDYPSPAVGAYAVEAVALGYIGLWIAGANLLAGPWLSWVRWVGVLAGLGTAAFAVGTLQSGTSGALSFTGGLGYAILLPAWALLMARHLARLEKR
jgi:hypothetical protein